MSDEGNERSDDHGCRCRNRGTTALLVMFILPLLQLLYFSPTYLQSLVVPNLYDFSSAKALSLNDENFVDDGGDDKVPQSSDIKKYAIVYLLTKASPNYLNALLGRKNYRRGTMQKLAPMTLVDYDAIFFLDLDVIVVQPLTSVFQEYRPPAMTYWEMYPGYDFNSGCQLMKPSLDMFNDAIEVLHELWSNKKNNQTATEIAHLSSK
ncbi:MAG: hypothetical protein SGARI_001019 [Bacillariaceae sp.]